MNKSELIDAIAKSAHVTKVDAVKSLEMVLIAIEDALKSGDSVNLVGFGSFSIKQRAARVGRNPATGAELQIPASKSLVFKPGKLLKDAVNAT